MTEHKVKQVLSEFLDYQPEIQNTDHLVKDLGADSLDLVEIEMRLERVFNIRIDAIDYGLEDPTVQNYIDEVERELQKKMGS